MGSIVSPVISLDRVSKRFQDRPALDEVSATIHPGQFVAVIGRSGAGKTTLLRCLARATTVGTGAIHFGDVDLAAVHGAALRAHRARVGMIYQQFNLVRRLRVMDNVLVGRIPHLRGLGRWAALARWFAPPSETWPCAACSTWAWSTRPGSGPTRCPAASSSAWRSPRSWPRTRASSSPTSRWPASTCTTAAR